MLPVTVATVTKGKLGAAVQTIIARGLLTAASLRIRHLHVMLYRNCRCCIRLQLLQIHAQYHRQCTRQALKCTISTSGKIDAVYYKIINRRSSTRARPMLID